MTNRTLARKARRQATREYREGIIDKKTYDKVILACENQDILSEWNAKISDARLNPWEHPGVLIGFDWNVIWDWFVANWPTILQILLVIIPMFLGDENEDSGTLPAV